MKKATLLIMTLLFWVSSGLSQNSRSMTTIDLTPTNLSQTVRLNAQATRGTIETPRQTTEVFSVLVQTNLEDEEVLQVLVDTTSGETDVPIGQISVFGGFGNLIRMNRPAFWDYWSDSGGDLPMGVSQIKTVRLVYQGDRVAEGSFAKPANQSVPADTPKPLTQ